MYLFSKWLYCDKDQNQYSEFGVVVYREILVIFLKQGGLYQTNPNKNSPKCEKG